MNAARLHLSALAILVLYGPTGCNDDSSDDPAYAGQVLQVTPPTASEAGGTVIEISTGGFLDDFTTSLPSVDFGGVPAVSVMAVDPVTLSVEVPPRAPGTVSVNITDSGGTATGPVFAVVAAVAPGDVIINEMLQNPRGFDVNRDGIEHYFEDEFVELVNLRTTAVDLSGYTLSDTVRVRHAFPNPTTLPPGGAIVVFGQGSLENASPPFAPAHQSGHAQVSSFGHLALNNSGETVTFADPLANVIDIASYGTGDIGSSANRSPDGNGAGVMLRHDLVPSAVPDPTTGGLFSPGLRANQTTW